MWVCLCVWKLGISRNRHFNREHNDKPSATDWVSSFQFADDSNRNKYCIEILKMLWAMNDVNPLSLSLFLLQHHPRDAGVVVLPGLQLHALLLALRERPWPRRWMELCGGAVCAVSTCDGGWKSTTLFAPWPRWGQKFWTFASCFFVFLPKKGALLNHVEGINMDFFFSKWLPSGKHTKNHSKTAIEIVDLSIKMMIFHSFLLTFTRGYQPRPACEKSGFDPTAAWWDMVGSPRKLSEEKLPRADQCFSSCTAHTPTSIQSFSGGLALSTQTFIIFYWMERPTWGIYT